MESHATTASIQRYLDALDGAREGALAEPVVRQLLERSADRLHALCGALLHRSYPRLARPPLGLRSEEMLSAVVERLLKALREARPATVRQFFALANRHMRWELNGLARSLDERTPAVELSDSALPAPAEDDSRAGAATLRILAALEALPEDEREVFELVRIQGLLHQEAAELLGVSTKTVQRRLSRGLLLLTDELGDLRADAPPA